MTIGARVAFVLAALVGVFVPVACSSGDDTAEDAGNGSVSTQAADMTNAAAAAMRLTLTDDGCAYDGPPTVASGTFTAETENNTDHYGAFAVAGIAEGSMLDDIEAYVEVAQTTFDETGALPEPPAFYSQAVRAGVEAGATGRLPADVPAGTYALMCFVDDLPTWRGYVAGQLDVTG